MSWSTKIFLLFCTYTEIPLKQGHGLWFEQSWILVTQGCFKPSLVEIGPAVLEKKIFKCCQCNFTILQLSPLVRGNGPSFEQTWIPFTQGCFMPSLVKIDPVVLEKKSKIGKVYRWTGRQTDDGRKALELSAQVS